MISCLQFRTPCAPTIARLTLLLAAVVLMLAPSVVSADETDEAEQLIQARLLLAELTEALDKGDSDAIAKIETSIAEFPESIQEGFSRFLDGRWEADKRAYREMYRTSAERMLRIVAAEQGDGLETHRETLQQAHRTKEKLDEALAAMDALMALFREGPIDLHAEDPDLKATYERVMEVARLRQEVGNGRSFDPETELTENLAPPLRPGLPLSRDARRVLEENEDLATEIPEAEADGIRYFNQMRLFMGQNPLLIDVALCEASRDHSKDMATEKFFSHTSPVKGKREFTRRAANFGTTADAENIAINGSARGGHRAWFTSTGHFTNMFGNHTKVGFGVHGRHMTQMLK